LQHCSLLSFGRYPTAPWGARASLQVSITNCLYRFRKLLTIHRQCRTQFDPKVVELFLAANRKGLIEDKAFCEKQGQEAAVLHLVAPGRREEA